MGRESFVLTTRSHQQAPFAGKALHVLAYLHVMLSTQLIVVYAGELPVYGGKPGQHRLCWLSRGG
jgi:hypothetical protein